MADIVGVASAPAKSREQSKWFFLQPGGRFSRSQFAIFYFVPLLITLLLALTVGVFAFYWWPIQAYIVIIAAIRRFHDLDRPGWHVLLLLVPILNLVMLVYLLITPGVTQGNRWMKV